MSHESRVILSAVAAIAATVLGFVCALAVALVIISARRISTSYLIQCLMFALFAGGLAVASGRLSRRLGRDAIIERGTCTNGGYDLRGSKDRCPECDKPIPRGPS